MGKGKNKCKFTPQTTNFILLKKKKERKKERENITYTCRFGTFAIMSSKF
jgi:hypothetical protein